MPTPSARARTLATAALVTVLVLTFAAPLGASTAATSNPSTTSSSTTPATDAPSTTAAPNTTTTTGAVHAAITAPSISVTPAAGLANGERVTVSGRRPAQVVVQCSAAARCDDTMAVPVPPGTDGSVFTVSLVVRRYLHLGSQTIDCATVGACRVQAEVTPGTLGLTDAFTYIRVDGAAGPAPSVTVTPSSALRDVQQVRVAATGFIPSAAVSVSECSADATLCQALDGPPVTVGDAGTVATDVHVLRQLPSAGPAFDCAVHTCVVRLSTADGDVATAALSFDASVPLAPPLAVTVVPDANLADGQAVAVRAVGFAPGDTVAISQCTVPAGVQDTPACAPLATAAVPATGTLATSVTVHATVVDSSGTTRACGTARCVLDVASTHAPDDTRAGLAFGGPLPVNPSVTLHVSPSTALVDRQVVDVSGDNLVPSSAGDLPLLYECVTGVVQYACATAGAGTVVPDAGGHYATTFRVQRVVVGADGTRYDCASAPARCTMTLDLAHAVPLTFDPSVAPAPPPAVSLTPASALADRTILAVRATGVVPGAYVGVSECRGATCDVLDATSGIADPSGTVDVTLRAFRVFEDLVAGRVDCTTGCGIRVDDGTGNLGIAAIAFDPALGLAGNVPTVAVRDAHALVGGGDTAVSGTGFAPFTSVVLAECPAGATDTSPCDAFDRATADAAGAFTTTTGTKAVLTTPSGALDCRPSFGTCVYAAWDGHDLFTAPIGFATASPTGVDPPATVPPATPPSLPVTSPVTVLGEQVSAPVSGSSSTGARADASGSSLPFTGDSPTTALAGALIALGAGAGLFAVSRRRDRRSLL